MIHVGESWNHHPISTLFFLTAVVSCKVTRKKNLWGRRVGKYITLTYYKKQLISNFWMIIKMFLAFFFSRKKEDTKGSTNGQTCGDKTTSCWNRKEKSTGFGTNCLSIRNEEKKIKQMMNEYLSLFKTSLQLALLFD